MTPATDTGTISVVRGGTLHFNAITVRLVWSGTASSRVDYAAMPSSVTFPPKVGVVNLTLIPLANANRRTAATATARVMPNASYAIGNSAAATVTISPPGNATGTGLTGFYYNSDSATVKAAYNQANLFDPAKLALSRTDPGIDFKWASPQPIPGTYNNGTYYTVAWAGQVQPQYSETYYFDVKADEGVKLWVNGQLIIDGWSYQVADHVGSIDLQGGVLYDIRMEFYNAAGGSEAHLYWYSNSRTRQIIPASRLYPLSASAPPAITSATTVVGFKNQPFTYTLTSSAAGVTYALGTNSGPLPPGLTLNVLTGIISGTPTTAGDYQVAFSATNANGTGAAAIDFQILPQGSGVTRELWTSGVAGTALSDVPFDSTPTKKDMLATLEDNMAYPARTGERLRGYFTAPATGNYYFWVAANNAADFWLSDNAEPVSKVRRAWITASGTGIEEWTASGQAHQRSPWLSLTAGQRYYYEVRHNTGSAANSGNLAVGWLLDPTGAATAPATGANGVVPGYLLSQYDDPAAIAAPGALYVTNLSPQGESISSGVGSANLRLNPEKTRAVLHFSYSGLTSPRTAYHIHAATDSTGAGPIVFDLDDVDRFHPELKTADGGYIWNIVGVGTQTAAQIVIALEQGYTYFNVHTVNYPNGEIRGNLGLVQGSQNPPTYVPDPGYPDDHGTDAGAARFLNQAAFGASPNDMAIVQSGGYAAWISNQISNVPATDLLADLLANPSDDIIHVYKGDLLESRWWRMAVTAPDQLRQRVAFGLSQILVVSTSAVQISDSATSIAQYNNVLANNAFGNFRDLLKQVTLNPAMGYWLNMQGNAKGNIITGLHPNENYAREIMQLFSIGLNRLWPDGTVILDSQGELVPTYQQDDITGMARVFTGWNWHQATPTDGSQLSNFSPGTDWVNPMSLVPKFHELGTKNLLDNVVLPAAAGTQTVNDPATAACNDYAMADLDQAIDNIFYHPNVGPFICRQLIQRLVSSNPSPAYLYRVASKFDDDGSAQHVRGNLAAVVRAILLDGEARDPALATASAGKQREPILRVTGPARTFLHTGSAGTYAQNGNVITVTLAAGSPPSRLASGDAVGLDFNVDTTGTPPKRQWWSPTTGNYTVQSTPAPTATSFSVNQVECSNVDYSVIAPTGTPAVNLTVNTGGPAIIKSKDGTTIIAFPKVYLQFLPAGSGPDGVYTLGSSSSSQFQVFTASAPSTASSTKVLVPKMQTSINMNNPAGTGNSIIQVNSVQNHNLRVGDHVWLDFSNGAGAGNIPSGEFTVSTIVDQATFLIVAPDRYPRNEIDRFVYMYSLAAPPITRTGKMGGASSKWDMGGTNGSIGETPYASATVFNFFAPDYKYPGALAAANVTTPEFQNTTDSEIVKLTNTLNKSFLSSGNPNGLSSFNNSGSILFDLSPYMAAPYTVNDTAGLNRLINKLGDLLTGGQLSVNTKTEIFNYITGSTTVNGKSTPNFLSTAPTNTRDRVRAIVQLILISPEYAIQR